MGKSSAPHWDIIHGAVARKMGVKKSVIASARQDRAACDARFIAMYMVRELTPYSLPMIGKFFGGRDHSTVLRSLDRANYMITNQPDICTLVIDLRVELYPKLKNQPDPVYVDALLTRCIRERLRALIAMPDHKLMEALL